MDGTSARPLLDLLHTIEAVRCRRMEVGTVQQRLDLALKRRTLEYKNQYESVSVLVLYWEKSDNPGFEKEARDVGNLFDQRCGYTVRYFPIPSVQSHLCLDEELTDFLKEYGRGKNRLIIIHYGGHGDEDVSGGKQAVWAASVFQVASFIGI